MTQCDQCGQGTNKDGALLCAKCLRWDAREWARWSAFLDSGSGDYPAFLAHREAERANQRRARQFRHSLNRAGRLWPIQTWRVA
jgi:hypothetical protein